MTSVLGFRPARVCTAENCLPKLGLNARARAQNSRTTRRNSIELNKSSGWRRVKGFPRSTLSASSVAYGASLGGAYRHAGTYAGQILKGHKARRSAGPAGDRVRLILNLKTAKALGLTVPPTLLASVDELIE